jgi:hypothetical protein
MPTVTQSSSPQTGAVTQGSNSTPGEPPKNPVLVPSYVQLESLENRAPIPQILVVTKEQIAGFNEVLKTFREQDYFHIQAQKLRNPKLKKAAENLAKQHSKKPDWGQLYFYLKRACSLYNPDRM